MWHRIVAFNYIWISVSCWDFFSFPKNTFFALKKQKNQQISINFKLQHYPKKPNKSTNHLKKNIRYQIIPSNQKSPPEFHSTSRVSLRINALRIWLNIYAFTASIDGNKRADDDNCDDIGFVKLRIYKAHGTHLESWAKIVVLASTSEIWARRSRKKI